MAIDFLAKEAMSSLPADEASIQCEEHPASQSLHFQVLRKAICNLKRVIAS